VVLNVDEEGTEAAAATAVTMVESAVFSRSPPPPEITFDRPFLLALVHDATGVPLVLGVIRDPPAPGKTAGAHRRLLRRWWQ
jgi:serpin B